MRAKNEVAHAGCNYPSVSAYISSRLSRPLIWAISLVALLILLYLGLPNSGSGPPSREYLLHTIGPARLSEGRLSGRTAWLSFDGKTKPVLTKKFRKAVISLQRFQSIRTPEIVGSLGLLALIGSQYDRAVKLFEKASLMSPGDATLLTDLSAVYLAAAKAKKDPSLLLQALEASQRALRIAPLNREARFNYAIITEHLHLTLTARKAWEGFLEVETDTDWRLEAKQRLTKLRRPTSGERWLELRKVLEAEVGKKQIADTVVEEFSQQLRQWTQEVLSARWADACQAGATPEADRLNHVILSIGRALADKRGELSVIDAASAINNKGCARFLVEGHIAYARGVLLYNGSRYAEAAFFLRKAESAFLHYNDNSPLLWTRLWLGGIEYYEGEHHKARSRLEKILNNAEIKRYPALRGRALWGLGLIELVHGDFQTTASNFESALGAFEEAVETENAGAIEALLGETLHLLGWRDEAWRRRFKSLEILSQFPASLRLQNLLFEVPDKLLPLGLPLAALEFQSEGISLALEFGGKDTSIAANLLLRARIIAPWDRKQAYADLGEARRRIRRIRDVALRQGFWFDSVVAEHELGARQDFEGIVELRKALSYYEIRQQPLHAAHVRLLCAKAELRQGDIARAEDDLSEGIYHQEVVSANVSDRFSFAEEWQDLFEEMVRLQVLRGDPKEAFEFAERSRAPSCMENSDSPCGKEDRFNEVRKRVPPGSALIEYFILPERLLIWRFSAGEARFWEVQVDSTRLAARINSLTTSIKQGDDDPSGLILLYDLLLRDPIKDLPISIDIVLVPDRTLAQVPFAALLESYSGRYMVEMHSLSYSQSAARFLENLRRVKSVRPRREWRVTALGNPSLGGRFRMMLPTLPLAEKEAEAIAQAYPGRSVITGRNVDRATFLASLIESEVVHFAGHGLPNQEVPRLSGIPLVSSDEEIGGDVLRGQDVHLPSFARIRLLVLSACGTSAGNKRRTEGLTGIATGFAEAGVPSVLAAQWDVSDKSSIGILLSFHKNLRKGFSGRSALRQAQLRYIRSSRKARRDIAVWAPYRLLGEV